MRRSATGVKHYSAAVLLGLPQSSSGQDMPAASSFEGLRMWGKSSMKIGEIFSKLVRHVPKPYSQPITPRKDVWSLFPGSPWASVAAIHRRRDHKAAAGSAVSFGSRNSHCTRPMPLHQHRYPTEWKGLSKVMSSIPGTVDAVASDYRFQSPTIHNLALDSSRMTGAPVYEASPTSVVYQSRPSQTASFAAARLMEELEEIISPHVTFYESPRTGRPVDRTKKYIKDEPIDFPVEDCTLNASPIIEPIESPTQQEQDAKNSQTHGSVWDGSPVPQDLATPFIPPRISDHNGPTGAKGREGSWHDRNQASPRKICCRGC